MLTAHLPKDQKIENVILHSLYPTSHTSSVVCSFSTVLPHAFFWGCVMGVLYQKHVKRIAVLPSRLRRRH